MIDFIVKYWIEFLFGGIIGILSYFVKHYYQLWKQAEENKQSEKFKEGIKEIQNINNTLLKAVLDVQRKQFKTDCRQLLESNALISFEQFENLHDEFEIYKSLGGNGPGETLFDLVQNKYSFQMIQKDQVAVLSENFELHPPIPKEQPYTNPQHLRSNNNQK